MTQPFAVSASLKRSPQMSYHKFLPRHDTELCSAAIAIIVRRDARDKITHHCSAAY